MNKFEDLDVVKRFFNGGWVVPLQAKGRGCLYTDSTVYARGMKKNPAIEFDTLKKAYNGACFYYWKYNRTYPYTFIDNPSGGIIISLTGTVVATSDIVEISIKPKTTGQQEGIVLQSGSIIQSEEMKF